MKNSDNYRQAQCCINCENLDTSLHEICCKIDEEYVEETGVCDRWISSQ